MTGCHIVKRVSIRILSFLNPKFFLKRFILKPGVAPLRQKNSSLEPVSVCHLPVTADAENL